MDLEGKTGLGTWERSNKKERKPQKCGCQRIFEKTVRNPPIPQEHTGPVRLVGFTAANSQTNTITAIARRSTDVLHTPDVPIEDTRPC